MTIGMFGRCFLLALAFSKGTQMAYLSVWLPAPRRREFPVGGRSIRAWLGNRGKACRDLN